MLGLKVGAICVTNGRNFVDLELTCGKVLCKKSTQKVNISPPGMAKIQVSFLKKAQPNRVFKVLLGLIKLFWVLLDFFGFYYFIFFN